MKVVVAAQIDRLCEQNSKDLTGTGMAVTDSPDTDRWYPVVTTWSLSGSLNLGVFWTGRDKKESQGVRDAAV